MKLHQCIHHPHVVRITFDIGNNQTEIFELCRLCQEFEVFRDFIITKEGIFKNNKTTEVKFSHITSAESSPAQEIIT